MASGSRRSRGNDEYVFVDGRAMRADEVVRIDLSSATVPGQEEAASVPGAAEALASAAGPQNPVKSQGAKDKKPGKAKEKKFGSKAKKALKDMQEEDAFALTPEAAEGSISMAHTVDLMGEDRHSMRVKTIIFIVAIVVVALASLSIGVTVPGTLRTPDEVVASISRFFSLLPTMISQPELYQQGVNQALKDMPYYTDVLLQAWNIFKFMLCGVLLALAGMLYQNTFRNPIAAPSMLGVTNGINFALIILVLQFGTYATAHMDLYYLYSALGGIIVLVLVMLGGKWISGKGRFNVVNMILMGTIISQMLGILLQYIQAYFMDDQAYLVYDQLQNATNLSSIWMYVTLIGGTIVALVPIILFRFKLNLVSFSDQDSRLLGVNPNKLRILALTCGSIMILVAQMNAGQVAMASLIIPFIARAVYGSEFRKQLLGNIVLGALIVLVCGCLGELITFDGTAVGLGGVVSIVAIPLFVWMLAIQQKSWE